MTNRTPNESLRLRAKALHLNGLLAHWPEVDGADWIAPLLQWEEEERAHRSLQRRIHQARLGHFKPMADFDWSWPKRIDRNVIEELMSLAFLAEAINIVFIGPNGVGKSMLAQNLAYQALINGHTVLFNSASHMLGELAALDSDAALRRRLRHYASPDVLVIDEVGYLSYSNRHADLLFELINRRYQNRSTLVTTNKPFAEWSEVFPNAACVVSLVDRLVHRAEVVSIEGDSYRFKEARERADSRAKQHAAAKSASKKARQP
jgi:DNA replication protein DnaC